MINQNDYKFEVDNIKSGYLRDWLNLLCNTKPRYEKFIDQFMDDKNMFHAACLYQKYLREEEGRGKDIKLEQIENALGIGDMETLNVMLQELFIEPIDNNEIEYLIKLIDDEELKVSDIYDSHKYDKDRGFWLTLKKMM